MWLEIFFESFESFWYFLQKPLAWFSNFYLRVQSKNCGRNSFLIFLFRIFSDFEQKIFQTFGQKTSKSCQNYLLRVQRNSLWLEIFFLKFWIVLNFLHKPSAWFSKFYLRVQSKNCGRNSFLIFLSGVYLDFERKFFQTFGEKTSKVVKTTFCMSRGTICGLNFFFKSFESFWIFCRIIGLGSQMSIYVSRVKIAEETVFLFFFAEFFCGFWAKNFSDFRPKNFLKFSKLPSTCPEDQFVAWNSFLKFWIVLDFLQKPSAWFSNFYLRVKSKNCGRNSFLFFFSEFFRILSENFFRLSAKNLQKVVKTTFCVSRGTICDLKYFLKVLNRFDIFCRKLWHGSQISIYVSRVKIAEETVFWFSFQNFFGFWAKIFSDFRQKIFKKLSKLTSACPEEQFVAWIFF